MNIKNIIIVGVAGALILLLGLGIGLLVGGNNQSAKLGGITNYDSLTLSGDLVVGGSSTLTGAISAASASISGAISSASAAISGALTSGAFTQGGGITATSTVGNVVPLLASNFDTENVIDVTLNVQDATLSFPASSTLSSIIPNAGDNRTLFVRNATTTADIDLTISGGTGVLLKMASSTNVAIVPGDTDGSNYAKIELLRKADTDIEALLSIFND